MTNPPDLRSLEFLPNTRLPAQAILNQSIPLFVSILPLLVLPAVSTALKERHLDVCRDAGAWHSYLAPLLHKPSIACSDHRSVPHLLQGLLPDSPSGRALGPTSFSAHEQLIYAFERPFEHRRPLAQRFR